MDLGTIMFWMMFTLPFTQFYLSSVEGRIQN